MVGLNRCTNTETNITFASKLFGKKNGATSKINEQLDGDTCICSISLLQHLKCLISSSVQASFSPMSSLTYYVNRKGNI